jgi:CRP-like cAMP-binding protein
MDRETKIRFDKTRAAALAAKFGWLSRAPSKFRKEVIRRVSVRQADAQQVIYSAGDDSTGIFGLVEGTVRIELVTGGSESQVAFIGRPGFWFGELAPLRRSRRVLTVTAAERSLLLQLSNKDYEDMAQDAASMRQFALIAAENLDLAMRVISMLLTRDPLRRVALILLTIASEADTSSVNVTQSDLASMCALTRKTVNEALAALKSVGVVRVGYKEIVILSRSRLAKVGTQEGSRARLRKVNRRMSNLGGARR